MKEVFNQQLVERLTQRMDLHRIFLFSYPYLEEERPHLLLVVNPVKGLAPKTMAPLVSLCFSDTEPLPFDIILAGEWQNQLKQGSLYYTYASLPQHELYAGSKKGNPLLSHKTIGGLLELAELNYDKCRKGSDEFREGVENFLAKGDYAQATFMLHQFLELRLKGFRTTVGINGGKGHNVEHLMKTLRGILPQLQAIFPYDSPSVDLFRLLDQSYTKAKKQESIEIGEDEFGILLDKCEQAKAAMDEMVGSMVARVKAYREQLPKEEAKLIEPAATKPAKEPMAGLAPATQVVCEDFSNFPWPNRYKRDVNKLLDKIRQNHNPEQVLLLNYHTGGFSGNYLFRPEEGEDGEGGSKVELYLVVLMNNKGPFHFRTMQVGVASAIVVYLNTKTVQKNLAEGNRFFHTLWTKGRILRRKATFEPSFEVRDVDWRAEYERVEKTWRNAKTCMDNLNALIQDAPALKLDTCFLLLRNLLEMGVSTYLRCAVGFEPYGVDLAELIDWSGVTGRKLLDFVYLTSSMETARMQLILSPHTVWWQNVEIGLSNISQPFYKDRAAEIVQFFEGMLDEVVKELEGKVEKEEKPDIIINKVSE
ncbi:MAG TPA: HEPN domain-containing protein [Parapedobacter sp.]|uniref:HEPN domain-containing protein n=1 Tax=Parapedobacter sp. TaxID=1958893 RepID=UPI002CEE8F4A|nr:HEPN domain-containing protein [Parapedobacter sp.]HWK58839.1 HEPN domain-containing protein [Parapedobacter sp.]